MAKQFACIGPICWVTLEAETDEFAKGLGEGWVKLRRRILWDKEQDLIVRAEDDDWDVSVVAEELNQDTRAVLPSSDADQHMAALPLQARWP